MTGAVVRILVVDDDDDDALLIRNLLAEARINGHVDADHAPSVSEALDCLGRGTYDVLVIDYRLGAEDGVSFLAQARARGVDAPAIVLTGQGDQEVAVLAMKAGAADYLVKAKLTAASLGASLRYALEIHRSRREREHAERALFESEERYRRVFNQALTGNYISTIGGRVVACNQAFAHMLGFEAVEQALAAKAYNLHADVESRDRFLAELGQRGRLESYEATLRRRDGGLISVIENVVAVRDAAGGIVEIQGSILDITGRKRTEQALLLRERAIEAMAQGLLITDPSQPENPIIYTSPGFERITGYSAAEVVGRNCRFLQGPQTDGEARARIREAVSAGEPVSVEILNYRKDGSTFWNYLSITPIRDETGRLTHFVGLQTDITERRQLEEQFRQAQKMEAVGRLAGGIAHDFNNLLGVILGYGDITLHKLPPESPLRRTLEEIKKAASRAALLTRQLLAYSRKQVLAPEVLDLNELLAGMGGMLERLIGEDIEVRTLLAPGVARIRADRGQIEQIVMNLAVNARDAMPRGGHLTIETCEAALDARYAQAHPDVTPGPYVCLAISDTGHGMDAETRAHAFEPFFTTKDKSKGTGLGLATVFGIVKQSGGHVNLYSEPERGTTFRIYLPVALSAADAAGAVARSAAVGGAETILLLEDDPSLGTLVREMLESLGYRVLFAQNGPEAVETARSHDGVIDLLLTDVVLTGMSGRDAARRLVDERPGLRTLYMSGYTDDVIARHGVLEEGEVLLQKPFTADALARRVRAVLERPVGLPPR